MKKKDEIDLFISNFDSNIPNINFQLENIYKLYCIDRENLFGIHTFYFQESISYIIEFENYFANCILLQQNIPSGSNYE